MKAKYNILLLIVFIAPLFTYSQGVGVNGDGAMPVAGTMLDVKGATDDNTTYGMQVKNSSGTAIMVVRSEGNVGIGTAAPQTKLHLAGNLTTGWNYSHRMYSSAWANPTQYIMRQSWDATNGDNLYLGVTGNSSVTGVGAIRLTRSRGIHFGKGNATSPDISTEHMRIDQNGNVGIGTSDPGVKLTLNGTASNLAGPHIEAYTSSSATRPVFQLLNWNSDNVSLNFGSYYNGAWTSGDDGSNFQIYKINDILQIRYDATVAAGSPITWNDGIALTSAGNVGIGTTTAGRKFTVSGDILYNNNAIIASDAGVSNLDHIWHDDGGNAWHFVSDAAYKANGNSTVYAGGFSAAGNTVWHAGNDGAGSGLSADNVDGINSTSFLRSDAQDQMSVTAHTADANTYTLELYSPNTGSSTNELSLRFHQGGRYWYQIRARSGGFRFTTGNSGAFTDIYAANIYSSNNLVWHAGNDGAGSGLDADLLDGISSGSFIRSDANDNVSGHIEWQDNYQVRLGAGADLRMWHNGSHHYFRDYNHGGGNYYFQGEDSGGNNENLLTLMTNGGAGYVRLWYNNVEKLRTTNAGITIYGRVISNGINETSDQRLKKNIIPLNNSLEKLNQLQGVSYDWKNLSEILESGLDSSKYVNKDRTEFGFIAQELEKVFPELVDTDEEGFKSVQYSKVVAILTEALKEESNYRINLENDHNKTKAQLNELKEKYNQQVEASSQMQQEIDAIKALLELKAEKE